MRSSAATPFLADSLEHDRSGDESSPFFCWLILSFALAVLLDSLLPLLRRAFIRSVLTEGCPGYFFLAICLVS